MRSLLVRTLTVLSMFYLCLVATSCSTTTDTVTSLQGTVNAVAALNTVKPGEEFDVNEYFSVLDRLSMQPGYVLDYVYCGYNADWAPCLYARQTDQPPCLTQSDCGIDETRPITPQYQYLDHVMTDGTPESFFQFIVLRTMGGQFNLLGHTNYNDTIIICDRTGLETLRATLDNANLTLPPNVWRKARSLSFEPTVQFKNDTVVVRVVVFTKWGGFIQKSYTITRDYPHKILQEERETLIEYDCGWVL